MTSGLRPAVAISATPRANPSAPVAVDAPSGTTNGWRPSRVRRSATSIIFGARSSRLDDVVHGRAEQLIEPRVAGGRRGRRAVERRARPKPERGAGGGGDARVIGLHAAARDERVGAGGERFGRHRLHLPHFVAAQAERQQVVALHEELRAGVARAPLAGASADRLASHAARARRTGATAGWRARWPLTRQSILNRMPSALVNALGNGSLACSVELRPPRAELDAAAGMDAWIDTYHAVRGLVRGGTFVFLTDSAVGAHEEQNLRHLVINLGTDVPRDRVVPFLTRSIRSSSVSRTPSAPGTKASARSSSSAAIARWARRGAWSTPGSCARRFASTCPTSRSAAGRIRTRTRPRRCGFSATVTSTASSS